MRIYLLRHGKAKSKDEDPDRHLTERGAQEVGKVADFVRPLGLRVRVIWHSGKARAAQTAEIVAGAVISDEGVVARDGLAPNDPIEPILGELEGEADDVMIVGHLPFLGLLASALAAGNDRANVAAFVAGGAACIERGAEADRYLRWMVAPAILP